jgi:hypothetical protein
LGIANRNSLTIFSAGPDSKTEVITHLINLFENLRPIANKNRSPDQF